MSTQTKYSEDKIAFARRTAPGKSYEEFISAYLKEYGIKLTHCQCAYLLNKARTRGGRAFCATEEQIEYVRNNLPGKHFKEFTEEFNAKFGVNISCEQMHGLAKRNGICNGLDAKFAKGGIPANKGKKMSPEQYAKCSKTMYKKGNIPYKTRKVGETRISKDGLREIKVEGRNKNGSFWRTYSRVVWEKHNGPIPKGMKVLHIDGDQLNDDISNLRLVTAGELAIYNREHRFVPGEAELNEGALLLAKIKVKVSKRKEK